MHQWLHYQAKCFLIQNRVVNKINSIFFKQMQCNMKQGSCFGDKRCIYTYSKYSCQMFHICQNILVILEDVMGLCKSLSEKNTVRSVKITSNKLCVNDGCHSNTAFCFVLFFLYVASMNLIQTKHFLFSCLCDINAEQKFLQLGLHLNCKCGSHVTSSLTAIQEVMFDFKPWPLSLHSEGPLPDRGQTKSRCCAMRCEPTLDLKDKRS